MSDPSSTARVSPPSGRSLHSVLVLAPIGCWSSGLAFDVASLFSGDPAFLVRVGTWLTGAGLVAAVVAGIAGMVAAGPIPDGTAAQRRMLAHMGLVMTLLVLYAFGLILRLAVQLGGPAVPSTLAISATGVLLVGITGWTGRAVRRSRPIGGGGRRLEAAGMESGEGSQRRDSNRRADSDS
ncbi:DUF2231 domain-containing protein [Pseudonocardia kunmingensis]|uniref:Putative membrane protein n=1 Tax=Pseudonocardia kunmingensis TaxID=630975 RepID=A0A543DKL6_9PSEU|nr:DUF2231 domain-containing protein [Pseudonocardia kunmingensis]TQM09872.1 putative membrane protein [Pseudonocardia kunmingensis]